MGMETPTNEVFELMDKLQKDGLSPDEAEQLASLMQIGKRAKLSESEQKEKDRLVEKRNKLIAEQGK